MKVAILSTILIIGLMVSIFNLLFICLLLSLRENVLWNQYKQASGERGQYKHNVPFCQINTTVQCLWDPSLTKGIELGKTK